MLIYGSHPVGSDGQNHIVVETPIKLLPSSEFAHRSKSRNETAEVVTTRMMHLQMSTDKQLDMKAVVQSTLVFNIDGKIEESDPQMSVVKSTNTKTRPPKKSKRKPKYLIKW